MSRESYARGFCKAAEVAGVDPQALAKYAAQNAALQAKTNANLMMMRQKIKPMIAKLMKGTRKDETRMNTPELQKHVNEYLRAGGKAEDLNFNH